MFNSPFGRDIWGRSIAIPVFGCFFQGQQCKNRGHCVTYLKPSLWSPLGGGENGPMRVRNQPTPCGLHPFQRPVSHFPRSAHNNLATLIWVPPWGLFEGHGGLALGSFLVFLQPKGYPQKQPHNGRVPYTNTGGKTMGCVLKTNT